jgi:glucose/arabinose dehydrogenase/mono/diheme cytochrome c family protein
MENRIQDVFGFTLSMDVYLIIFDEVFQASVWQVRKYSRQDYIDNTRFAHSVTDFVPCSLVGIFDLARLDDDVKMTNPLKHIGIALAFCLAMACANQDNNQGETKEPSKPEVIPNPSADFQSPEATIASVNLPEGYKLELVASESMLNEPVAIAWDGNGRMYVAEMCTYMQDVDGTDTKEPWGKILLLEDTDNDGKMDKRSIYIDSLVLPRMILPLDDRLLVNETYTYDLWSYSDTNGDGVADEKIQLYHEDKVDNRNLEHQASGLIWNIDNWIYNSRNPVRFKFVNDKILVDSLLDAPQGQWGLTHDDFGRLYYSSAGGEVAALGFQQNPAYGSFELDDQLMDDFDATWPIIATPDVQGGLQRLRPDSTLNHFTASCGQEIFQGDHLPEDMRGDLFICEPVGRLIRRAKVINQDGQTFLKSAYDQKEFLASTDMNFRPVNLATGPDGCLYIVDMYRGIIQESNWTREGSFLRPVIKRMGLDKNIGRGRIYRLVYDGDKPGPRPQMLQETSAELVNHLAHPNGWWRNTAQKLLLLRNDKSVVKDLEKMAANNYSWFEKLFSSNDGLAVVSRIHALWTLKGLGALEKNILLRALADEDPQVRKTAIWLSEDYLKAQDEEIRTALKALKGDSSGDVRIQLVLSLRYDKSKEGRALLQEIKESNVQNTLLQALATASLTVGSEPDFIKKLRTEIAGKSPYSRELISKGAETFRQLCATCHGIDGKGVMNKEHKLLAPPLFGSKRVASNDRGSVIRILLHGLSGPVDGKVYPDVMPSMEANDDEWIASVLSYVRFRFGDDASTIRDDHVKAVRDENNGRKKYWTIAELEKLEKK